MKGKYLITTHNWFTAPDGKQYSAVFGDVEIVPDTFLGIKTNRQSANWYAKVGTDDKHVIIAGCQIMYAVKTDKVNVDEADNWDLHEGKAIISKVPSRIYVV